MNYFWFDHKAKGECPEHETFKDLVELFNAKMVTAPTAVRSPCVCFVHPSTAAGKTSADWEGIADVDSDSLKFVALLSFGGDPTSGRGISDGVATLQRDNLRRGLANLKKNENAKAEFIRSVEYGKPDWDLLAPRIPEMDNIIAYYLVRISGVAIDKDVRQQLRTNARSEYVKMAKLVGSDRIQQSIDDVDTPSLLDLLETWSRV